MSAKGAPAKGEDGSTDGERRAGLRYHKPVDYVRAAQGFTTDPVDDDMYIDDPSATQADVMNEDADMEGLVNEDEAQTPQTETPQTETPQTETPQTETPQTETPQTETPQTETPQTETPQTEKPQTEKPLLLTPQQPQM
ncbi:hypothetical protein PInf_026673 [Phytophthora infestans]|nr:hypothetical protein PInf_026673 [Phytophthora infestans]